MKLKRFISLLLIFAFIICMMPTVSFADDTDEDDNPWWKKVKEKASEVASSASDAAGSVLDSSKKYLSKVSLPDFLSGWNTSAGFFGATLASLGGQQYVNAVANAIDDMQRNVTIRVNTTGSSIAQKAGFVAEEWHAGTYNIDAIAKDVKNYANTAKSNSLGSSDVSVNNDIDVSMKYYKTAEESAKQQARITQDSQKLMEKYGDYISRTGDDISFDDWLSKTAINLDDYPDLYWETYQNQVRVIPSDQLDDAQVFLKKAIEKESAKSGANRQAVSESYIDTLKNLSDRIETADGTQSVPLSKEDAEAIAKAGMDNDFKPSEFGINTSNAIKGSYVAKQAVKAGASSAIIEAAIVIGPQLYEIIKYLIETGELDTEQLKETGIDGLSAAADGFLKGSISNALVIMCQAGKLGSAYTSASPELIGALTVLVIDAIRYGIKVANGQMSSEEYADILAQEVLVSAASLGSAALIGMLFPGATLAICLGSFVGGLVVSAGYPVGKEYALAMIDSGGVNILVPIDSAAEAIKGKKSSLSAKLSDSLKDIKVTGIPDLNSKTIKVFDFT